MEGIYAYEEGERVVKGKSGGFLVSSRLGIGGEMTGQEKHKNILAHV